MDIKASHENGLSFVRHFNSVGYYRPIWREDQISASYKDYWRHNYSQRLIVPPDSSGLVALAIRPSGELRSFDDLGLESSVRRDYGYRLWRPFGPRSSRYWRLWTPDNVIEDYDRSGRLLHIGYPDGRRHNLVYQNDLLVSVTDQSGRQLSFTYDTEERLQTVQNPNGDLVKYFYDEMNRLGEVHYSDGSQRIYIYGSNRYNPYALSGIIDENGNQYATYHYNDAGRIILSTHAQNANKYEFNYYGNRTSITDPLGTVRSLYFQYIDGVIRPTSVSQPCEQCGTDSASISYYPDGHVQSRTDFNGNVTTYTYNTHGLETSKTEGAGTLQAQTITTIWDTDLRLPIEIEDGNKKTIFTYNSRGQTLSRTIVDVGSNKTRTWSYTYCSQTDSTDPSVYCPIVGLLKTANGPRTDVWDNTRFYYYNAPNGAHHRGDLWRVVNAAHHTTEYLEYDANGRVLVIQKPNSSIVRFTYDVRGRLTERRVQHPVINRDLVTGFTYDSAGNLIQVALPGDTSLTYEFDTARRLISIQNEQGNRVEYTLDPMGNRITEKILAPDGSTFRKTSREYDNLDRLIKIINGVGDATTFGYDSAGNRTSVTDPKLNTTNYQYDALNRLSQTMDALSGITSYTYDLQDHLISVSDPRGVHTTYNYNGFGDLISESSPDSGTKAYTYDSAGNRSRRTDARGVATSYQFDELNRLTAITYPNGSRRTFAYDQGAYGAGKLTTLSYGNDSIRYVYNGYGRLRDTYRFFDSRALEFMTRYHYYKNGDIYRIEYPSGISVNYLKYGTDDVRTVRVQIEGVWNTLASNVSYAPFGPITGFAYGDGQSHTRTYDLAGRRVSWRTGTGDPDQLIYDAASNISAWNSAGEGNDQLFYYDDLNRLTQADGAYGVIAYTYDAVGNRLHQNFQSTTGGEMVTDYTYAPDSNRLLQAGEDSYSYDAAGNPIQVGNTSFTFGSTNRLTHVTESGATVAAYQYNPLGQRVVKITPSRTTYFAYDMKGRLIGEYNGQGQALQEYIYLHGEPLALLQFEADEVDIYYFHNDHRGAAHSVTAQQGNEAAFISYKPFGRPFLAGIGFDQPVWTSNPPALTFRFPGQYADAETDLYYNYFRYYDPDTGRYLTSDPIGLAGGLNTFIYAKANPIIYIDKLGLFSCKGKWKQVAMERVFNIVCRCVWICIPCNKSILWSGNPHSPYLPRTTGTLVSDTGRASTRRRLSLQATR